MKLHIGESPSPAEGVFWGHQAWALLLEELVLQGNLLGPFEGRGDLHKVVHPADISQFSQWHGGYCHRCSVQIPPPHLHDKCCHSLQRLVHYIISKESFSDIY